jgi:hypothetical protein
VTAEEDWQRLSDAAADLRRVLREELDRLLGPLVERLARWLS